MSTTYPDDSNDLRSDGGRDELTFTTDRGANVTVSADSGTLFVSVESTAIDIERTSAFLEVHKGTDVLNLGTHRVQGSRQTLQIPVEEYKEEIEAIREGSKDDSPLTYEVEEYTTSSTAGGWGEHEITKQRLVQSKSVTEMTEREKDLWRRVDTDDVPDDAEPGDVLTPEELLDGDDDVAQTIEEKKQDALNEAAETGEEIILDKTITECNDPSKECNLDHVTRVATPDGEIEIRRIHTY